MRIGQVVSSIENVGAGVAYSVPRLAAAVADYGHDLHLLTLSSGLSEHSLRPDGVKHHAAAKDLSWAPWLCRLGISREMAGALRAQNWDILHTHGLWMMPNVYPTKIAQTKGVPLFLSPRGMLGREALMFSRPAKRLFWAAWQKHAVDGVTCIHATAESEYEDVRAFGLKQPVSIIPNGIDLPDLSTISAAGESSNKPQETRPFILSLGRLHPKKGLDRLISAFALVADEQPKWCLRIVGPDERGHAADLSRQISNLALEHRVSIEPPIFGDDKFRLMLRAKLFALPTLHENFGMTVAESLAVETPVISSKGAPWAGLETHGCGWWVDHEPQAIAAALREAMMMPSNELRAMGARGRNWMQRDFAWEGIGAKMLDAYRWTLGEIARPDWVWK